MSTRRAIASACVLLTVVILVGCAASEPSRFYTLAPQAPSATAATTAGTSSEVRRNVALSPVQVPRYLDRPQLVTRSDANTLEFAEFDKWSEPLADMIGRVLAEDLSHRLPNGRVFLLPIRQAVPIERIVDVQVMRFEADAAGLVTLHARWQVFTEAGRKLVKAEETLVREPAAGAGKAAQVAAMSRALSRLAADIAGALPYVAAEDARGAEGTSVGLIASHFGVAGWAWPPSLYASFPAGRAPRLLVHLSAQGADRVKQQKAESGHGRAQVGFQARPEAAQSGEPAGTRQVDLSKRRDASGAASELCLRQRSARVAYYEGVCAAGCPSYPYYACLRVGDGPGVAGA